MIHSGIARLMIGMRSNMITLRKEISAYGLSPQHREFRLAPNDRGGRHRRQPAPERPVVPSEQGIPGHGWLLGEFTGERSCYSGDFGAPQGQFGATTAPARGKGRGTQNAEIWPSSSVGGNVGCP
jgi:hypothetical protein